MAHLNLPLQPLPSAHGGVFVPSDQQAAIFDWIENGHGSAIIQAVAGSGKTTTLIEALRLMRGNIFFGAYNKKIVLDIQEKLAQRGIASREIRVSTLHSAGLAAWMFYTNKSAQVNQYKMNDLCRKLFTHPGDQQYEPFALEMVSLAKQTMLGINGSHENLEDWMALVEHFGVDDKLPMGGNVEDGLDVAYRAFTASIAANQHEIDMDDMIFAPLLHNANFYKQDWVLIDEAQDTNFARRLMAERMLKPGGRLVAVGDSHQAIYGFTGADNNSMDLIRDKFRCIDLPLTLTYRCPKNVVKEARKIVSHIEAHESAQEGLVTSIHYDTLKTMRPFATDAILCRYTAPLIDLALHFIRNQVACRVEGREIGKSLVTLVKRFKASDIDDVLDKLEDYIQRERNKAGDSFRKKRKIEQLTDKVDTIRALSKGLLEQGNTSVSALISRIENLFSDDVKGMLTLSTVHKSKGREWDRVFILGRDKYMPSVYATMPWEHDQENNLIYVAVTRAKRELVYVTAKAEKLEREGDEEEEVYDRADLPLVVDKAHSLENTGKLVKEIFRERIGEADAPDLKHSPEFEASAKEEYNKAFNAAARDGVAALMVSGDAHPKMRTLREMFAEGRQPA